MEPFFGNFDLAQLSLYLFWLFFAGLVIYLQRENMREGYPLEDEDGKSAPNEGPFGMPMAKKTFNLPHGHGSVTVPDDRVEQRKDLPLARTMPSDGYPYEPTGNPMVDGVGPASYAMRQDVPELDAHGNTKIVPMRTAAEFSHSAGRDPRGMPVLDRHGQKVGTVTDMWIDKPESLVRYLQADLDAGGTKLLPITMARITPAGVKVHNLTAGTFAGIPEPKSDSQITLLEEEKIVAYIAGGQLYAQ